VQNCELRGDGKAGAGWDVMVFEGARTYLLEALR
jgi:hypothetical protein